MIYNWIKIRDTPENYKEILKIEQYKIMLDLYKKDIHPEIVDMILSDTFAEFLVLTTYWDYFTWDLVKEDIKKAFDERKLVEFMKYYLDTGSSLYDIK